jgi:ABC-2 type transport system ATP-binding protein
MTTAILVENLSKHYRIAQGHGLMRRAYRLVHAVDDISFTISRGDLVGYLGPNGAGKSTTIKILTGILVPNSGVVQVSGRVPWRQRRAHVAHIGAVFGQRNTLWWDLPVADSFDLLRHIYRIPPDRYMRNLAYFRELLGLGEFMPSIVRSLSLGQLMRANLAAAFLHDPDIVFLDEPTIGLDVVAKERIRQFIRDVNRERGTTVILTTHDLADVARLCERVMMIDHGKLLFDGKLAELIARFGGERELVVDFAEPYSDVAIEGARIASHDGLRVTYRFSRETATASDLIGRLSAHYRLQDVSVREPDIEATVRRIYEEQLLSW